MISQARPMDDSKTLESYLQRELARRTAGRMREIHIEVADDTVVVRGVTCSYYVKQLAIQGVLDALESSSSRTININIRVDDQPSSLFHHS